MKSSDIGKLYVSEIHDPNTFDPVGSRIVQLGWPVGSRIERINASKMDDLIVTVMYPDGSHHIHIAQRNVVAELLV